MDKESLKQHQSLYKLRTPPWKDAFRARCFQRLKSSRSVLVDKFRGLGLCSNEALGVMMDEDWSNAERNKLPHLLTQGTQQEVTDSEINEFLSIMEEIKKELLEEEQKLLEEYSKNSDANLAYDVNDLEKDEVICPICKKNVLLQNYTVIFCACGVRIDVQDGLTLQNLKSELSRGVAEHEHTCCHPPHFSMITFSDIANLTITCGACNFMYIVI